MDKHTICFQINIGISIENGILSCAMTIAAWYFFQQLSLLECFLVTRIQQKSKFVALKIKLLIYGIYVCGK